MVHLNIGAISLANLCAMPHRPRSIISVLLAKELENVILRFGYVHPAMVCLLLGGTRMNKDQVKGRVEEAKGKVGFADLKEEN